MKQLRHIFSLGMLLAFISPTAKGQIWSATTSMTTPRGAHTATLLPNGKVLVTGGAAGTSISSILATTELYDPATASWTLGGAMTTSRCWHTATLLMSGKVLIAGGLTSSDEIVGTAEIYDPSTGISTPTGSLLNARGWHTATLLPDGKVLVMGGFKYGYYASAEVYDPLKGSWTVANPMPEAHGYHTATTLPNGKILVTGGVGVGDFRFSACSLYDFTTGIWTPVAAMSAPRWGHKATLLSTGNVLITGGSGGYCDSSTDLYNPATDSHAISSPMLTPRLAHTATLLLNGSVLVAGGDNCVGQLSSAELFQTFRIASDLTNVTAVVGGDAAFAVEASGAGPFSYQWFYTNSNPLAVAGGYPLSIAGFVYGVTITNGGLGYGSVPDVRFVGGSYALPASGFATVSNGSVSSITVTNPGLNYTVLPAVVIDPPSGLLVDQTNSTLTLSNVGPSNLGSYWVVVSNSYGSITSSVANITLLYPPSIAVSPVSQNLALRGATILSVTAAGTPPFSYQWTLAGTNLPSATNSTLALTNFSLSQAGSYAVRVSSPYGTATSGSAQVSMLPSLNVPFAGGVNLWGQPATLTVGAVGTGPLVYQWYFNGQTIAGATSNSYTIPTIQFTNAGFYSVVVSSSLGSVTNTPYQVVVNPANVSLGLYPGITVSGTVGYTYTIQGTTDLSDTNAWVTLANLTLTQPVQIWSDYTADTTQSQNPRKFYRVVAGNVPVGMALIPAGPFTMGDTLDGDANALPVTVTVSAFYMDTNLVSKAVWDDVYSWAIGHGYTFDNFGSGKASTHPVQTINWWDSVKWCNARSEKEGRAPAYYRDAGLTTVYRSGQLSPTVNWAGGYRLPTEAEWEKAARGGLNQNRFPWGNTISQSLANFQNIGGESYQTGPTGYHAAYATGAQPYTSPVGSFAPNGYGLFDMSGNLHQWCWDWYGTPYAGGADPRGAASGSNRVLRGGSWRDDGAVYCRTAYRAYDPPAIDDIYFGFRSVLPPGQ